MVLARLQLDRGAQGEALQTLEAGLPHGQHSAEYLTMTAAVMTRAGRHREAAALYESALRLGPGNAVWYMGLGLALRADGRPRDALAAFQRARDLKALNPELQAFVERSVRELQ
jgi:MSHA biogenesis protein MshN